MRVSPVLCYLFLFGLLTVSPACASGRADTVPPFDPERNGWQSVMVVAGDGSVATVDTRMFEVLYKNGTVVNKTTLDMFNENVMAPTMALYAGSGVRFSVRRSGNEGNIRISLLHAERTLSLTGMHVKRIKKIGTHLVYAVDIHSIDSPLPNLPGDAGERYFFQGVLVLPLERFPGDQYQLEFVISRALEVMLKVISLENGPSPTAGRAYLVDYRIVHAEEERIAVYCRLIADL